MRFVMVAALALGGVAGCFGEPSQATFDDLVGTAREAAEEWSPGAELIDAEGREWSCDVPQQLLDELDIKCDPNFGDGRATEWEFMFQTASDPVAKRSFRVDAGGKVRESSAEEGKTSSETGKAVREDAVGDVRVDSDTLARTLRNNSTWRALLKETNVTAALWGLHADDNREGTVVEWGAVLFERDGHEIDADVDAITGRILGLSEHFPSPPLVIPEFDRVSVVTEVMQPEVVREFTLELSGHPRLFLTFFASSLPLVQAEAEVRSPGGNLTTLSVETSGPTEAQTAGAEVAAPEAGIWQVTFRVDPAVTASLSLDWCAQSNRDLSDCP